MPLMSDKMTVTSGSGNVFDLGLLRDVTALALVSCTYQAFADRSPRLRLIF